MRIFRAWIALLLVICCAHAAFAQVPALPPSWDYAPYRIGLTIVPQAGSVEPARVRTIPEELTAELNRTWSGACRFTEIDLPINETPKTSEPTADAGSDPPVEPSRFEKRIEIDLARVGEKLIADITQHDETTRTKSAVRHVTIHDEKQIVQRIASELSASFAPVLRASKWEQGRALLRIRGGKLRGIARNLTPGTIVVAFERPLNPEAAATAESRIRPLRWTWLVVDRVDDSIVQARVFSGLPRNGDPGENEPIEILAIPTEKLVEETVLEFRSSLKENAPLAGVRVVARVGDDRNTVAWTAVSDSDGKLKVSTGEKLRVETLEIGTQDERVAICPLTPGTIAAATIRLPLSTSWFEIQNDLERRRDELLELQAKKLLLQTRISAANAKSDVAEGDRLRAALKSIPNATTFLAGMPTPNIVPAKPTEEDVPIEGEAIVSTNAEIEALLKRQTAAIADLRLSATRILGSPVVVPKSPPKASPESAVPSPATPPQTGVPPRVNSEIAP